MLCRALDFICVPLPHHLATFGRKKCFWRVSSLTLHQDLVVYGEALEKNYQCYQLCLSINSIKPTFDVQFHPFNFEKYYASYFAK